MALVLADVRLLIASGNDTTSILAQLLPHFQSVSTKFSVVGNGANADGFTLVSNNADDPWYLNIRRSDNFNLQLLIDPLANITNPGNAGASPTLTSNLEASAEINAIQLDGTESVRFYVIETIDAIILLFLDGNEEYIYESCHAGRIMRPQFSGGYPIGDNYIDGLGILGGSLVISTSSGARQWYSTTTVASVVRIDQNLDASQGDQWAVCSAVTVPTRTNGGGLIQGRVRFPAFTVRANDVDGSGDASVGKSAYLLTAPFSAPQGTTWDGGPGNDCWVHVQGTNVSTSQLIPWNRDVTPIF